jgi:hypothetical protein
MILSKQRNTFRTHIHAFVILVLVIFLTGVAIDGTKLFNTHKTLNQAVAQLSPTVIPISPGWKLLQSQDMNFKLQYPSTLSFEEKEYRPGDMIVFNSHANSNGQDIGLVISYTTKDIIRNPNNRFLIDVLLTSPVGNVPTGNIEGYGDNVITKIADLTINSHRAVHATLFRKGGTLQQPRYCETYSVLKDSNHYYSLDTCTTNETYAGAKAEVTQYSGLMEEIVNTFTIN